MHSDFNDEEDERPAVKSKEFSASRSCFKSILENKAFCYGKMKILKKISQKKLHVLLVNFQYDTKPRILKVYPFKNGKPSISFYNEARFRDIRHQNIISMIHYSISEELEVNGSPITCSFILMEYASYGDFSSVIALQKNIYDDKLARTYFHQLINGLEYLHSLGACHHDIKTHNLLLDECFDLKIADFDLSYHEDDKKIKSKGTENYRPPELREGRVEHPFAVDIYSAGIVLFVLKTGGRLPFGEEDWYNTSSITGKLKTKPEEFWDVHSRFHEKLDFFDHDFREIFSSLIEPDPAKRIKIEDIKKNKWFCKETYSRSELNDKLRSHFNTMKIIS
jgi:serine/threonine protein kinase